MGREKHQILKKAFWRCLSDRKKYELSSAETEEAKRLFLGFVRIVGRFFFIKKDLYFISDDNFFPITQKNFDYYAEEVAGEDVYYFHQVDEKTGKSKRYKTFVNDRIDAFLRSRQIALVDYEIDPFRSAPVFVIKNEVGGSRLQCIYDRISIKEPDDKIEGKILDEIIDDYKDHFPDLDSVIDFISASRFSSNRKATFLHLLVKSNWGKSFFSAALQEIGVGYEIRYSDISENRPVGVNPLEIMGSFCLLLDEFKYFSKEMKKITTEMTVEPKFGFKSKVPVYAKILMSAEESESFADGVDEQIINRVIRLNYTGENVMKLDDRKVFRKYGAEMYKTAVKIYIAEKLKSEIEKYIEMGKFEADRAAAEKLEKIQRKRKLVATNLRAEIMRIYIEFFNAFLGFVEQNDIPRQISDIAEKCHIMGDGNILVASPNKILIDILRKESDDSFFAKAKHKKAEIITILNPEGAKSYKINGKSIRGVKININDLEVRYNEERGSFQIFGDEIPAKNAEEIEKKMNERLHDWKEKYPDYQITKEAQQIKTKFSIVPVESDGVLVAFKVHDKKASSAIPF